ncbi:MAG: NAD-dependent protein deacylase [Bacilli bacterium]|nr:NAD-dependent protein deacylase [Bacilli bacterium]
MTNKEKIKLLNKYIKESNNIIFFGGAGVSTESGIKDFRSVDGLYNEKYDYPPEEILSHSFFINNTKEFYKFYKDKMNCLNIKPNICHKYLTKLEQSGKLKAIITQNIDGLHQKANSKNILELHGTIYKNYCMKCNKFYDAENIFNSNDIPKCSCGGIIKPDVVLYEEPLNEDTINKTINYISNADLLIIGGTSLTVYPASSFIRFFRGKHLIIINRDITPMDNIANLVINDSLGNVFKNLN